MGRPTKSSQRFSTFVRPGLRRRACAAGALGTFALLPASAVLVSADAAQGGATEPAAPLHFAARDVTGREHAATETGARATVWLFIAHDCPICNSYAPEVHRLATEYITRGIAFNIVYAEPGLERAALLQHAAEHAESGALFSGGDGTLARACGVTTTPEAAVIDARGQLLYRGRIDNRYTSPGHERTVVTEHDLREALEAVIAGHPVSHPRTAAVGCALATPG